MESGRDTNHKKGDVADMQLPVFLSPVLYF